MDTDSVQPSLLTCYETEGIWKTRTLLSTNGLQGPFQMLFVSAALETLLVWNKDTMLYSFHNDSEWRYLRIMDSSNISQEASGSHIHHVVMDRSRNMLVKMENNVLFFCKFGMNKLFRLPTWNDPGHSVVLYLNQKEQIIMLTMLDGGLHVQKYPLKMEIRSAMRGEVHSCPFIGFTHNMNKPVYYIDKEEAIEFWAQATGDSHEFSNVSQTVFYDWKSFGCVLRIHYKDEFQPDIELYDGETFVRSVDANFIVWENFHRKDYYFNMTMHEVISCLHEAQTWTSMLVDEKHPEEAWGPHNYRSCFVDNSEKLGNLDQPYEIMNRSSMNYLTFSRENSAIYVFNVKIVDPNYRCLIYNSGSSPQPFLYSLPSSYLILILTCLYGLFLHVISVFPTFFLRRFQTQILA
uniref:Catsper channel auxiliary subunit epsilon n=1 Tax=Sinocyclocheilus anshuiensis TaxID=1608454 RepID=A0A671SB23_9TELE